MALFGFAAEAERTLFELLLGVSGIGPKAALAIVSGYAPDQIRRAVATSDYALFTSIPGIGRSTAERVVIDLKDKVGAMAPVAADSAAAASHRRSHRRARCAGRPRHVGVRGRSGFAAAGCRAPGRGTRAPRALRRIPAGAGMTTSADPRLPDAFVAPGEEEFDRSLRPRNLSEFVGQEQIKEQLSIFLEAAKATGESRASTCSWPARRDSARRRWRGIIATEMHSSLRVMSGPAIDRKADMAAILTALEAARRALHRRDPPAQPLDRGAALPGDGGRLHRHGHRPGAGRALDPARPETVHAGGRDHAHRPSDDAAARPVRHHPPARLLRARPRSRRIVRALGPAAGRRASTRAAATRSPAAPAAPRGSQTGSCAGSATSPRCATRARSPTTVAVEALELFEVDERRSRADRPRHPRAIAERFAGGPVGLSTLAVAIGEEPDTLEDVYEPYLLQLGMLQRTPRGRIVTPAGYAHLGLPAPARDPRLF